MTFFSRKNVPFGGSVDIYPHLTGQIPRNHNFGIVNRHFQAKRKKYLKFHFIETTAWITTKFCTPVKTTKHASRVVQKCGKLLGLQCFDAVGWAAGRASGL